MIEFTEEMREKIGNALADGFPVVTSSVNTDGQPTISFYGSTQVFSSDQLAIWVRSREGGLVARIPHNPRMAFLYRNPTARLSWQIHGRARLVDDPAITQQIYENTPQRERDRDSEQQGSGVIIDVDRVIARGEVLMER
jgi:general stress protein 26